MDGNSIKFVNKPKQLALNRRYIQTDVKTILAFALCTTEKAPSFDNIDIRDVGDISIVKINAGAECRPGITKHCLGGRISGYPPWYREKLVVAHGPIIPQPIRSRDDIHRAGWVLAVGLSKTQYLSSSSADYHLMGQPVKRVLSKLRYAIKPHFQTDPTLEAAISAIGYMLRELTGSGVGDYLTDDLNEGFSGSPTAALRGSDCGFALSLFNTVGPLDGSEISRLAPILNPVIDAAFRGSYIVIQHFKNRGDFSRIPSSLENLTRQVYLDLGTAN
ncbi:MAG: hypothetical protein Q9169_007908 [Polycauliona sp. 2 TL-2023]